MLLYSGSSILQQRLRKAEVEGLVRLASGPPSAFWTFCPAITVSSAGYSLSITRQLWRGQLFTPSPKEEEPQWNVNDQIKVSSSNAAACICST